MWTAVITEKKFENGELFISVNYDNGKDNFTEVYSIRNSIDIENRISSRLTSLNDLDLLVVPIGLYTPKPTVVSVVDPKAQALQDLKDVQSLVTLGVLIETDKKVTDAIQAVKNTL